VFLTATGLHVFHANIPMADICWDVHVSCSLAAADKCKPYDRARRCCAQGCITALESCTALAAAFEACGDDLDRAPAAFTAARAPDAHAMQELELMQARPPSPQPLTGRLTLIT
jgi:hypothetical protein